MQNATIYRKDYQAYPFTIQKVELFFNLDPQKTQVKSILHISSKENAAQDLVLNGENIELVSIVLNGNTLDASAYELKQDLLSIKALKGDFTLEINTLCNPSANTTLMGLYISGGKFFTQCEAEGFRRITFFPDRPDVMSTFTVTLTAEKKAFPYLLSNGNLISTKELNDGLHQAVWHDPFPKPCYLFALVAGNFDLLERTVKTQSQRDVLLQMYSDPGYASQTEWALDSLERSLRWDEKRFGLELDLDRFMVVAVRDFNMGAMENKGLNIFNSAYILATPQTATDDNYAAIEAVVGHEYFHNWTGNRVTCRDWFQLSLKEGLTVFRDQEFSADMMAANLDENKARSARAIKRIEDVARLRSAQFPEDAGPMAHPIRPDSYQDIGNFYTATVYEKGAEIIRMFHTFLGEAGFREGMDEYFRRHDGQAVTCDDFLAAMDFVYRKNNPGKNFEQFALWYAQAGTPVVTVKMTYDQAAQTCTIDFTQNCPPVGVEKLSPSLQKQAYHIPILTGLLDQDGNSLTAQYDNQEQETLLLELRQASQRFTLNKVKSKPILSVLRDFSAPVIVRYERDMAELILLAKRDSNPFARYEASQELMAQTLVALCKGEQSDVNESVLACWQSNLLDPSIDSGYRSWLLSLPSDKIIEERLSEIDPHALNKARKTLSQALASYCEDQLVKVWQDLPSDTQYSPDPISAGKRRLKNSILALLAGIKSEFAQTTSYAQFAQADNMTDQLSAFSIIVNHFEGEQKQNVINSFYTQWEKDPLVIDKWFAIQACSKQANAAQMRQLQQHPAFVLSNPNRARSLIFQFCLNNSQALHASDGSGYQFWADNVIALNKINPEVAARLARAFDQWSRYVPEVRTKMQEALEYVAKQEGLSSNVAEIISKALSIS